MRLFFSVVSVLILYNTCYGLVTPAIRTHDAVTISCSARISDDDEGSTRTRRRFLVQQSVLAGLALISPSSSEAATVTPDLAKITTAANKKVGGLSNKIRKIANVMVGFA